MPEITVEFDTPRFRSHGQSSKGFHYTRQYGAYMDALRAGFQLHVSDCPLDAPHLSVTIDFIYPPLRGQKAEFRWRGKTPDLDNIGKTCIGRYARARIRQGPCGG